MPMRRLLLLVAASAATVAPLAARADAPTYVMGIPSAPTIYITPAAAMNEGGVASAEDNPWLALNGAYPSMALAATTGGVSRVERADEPQLVLESAESGFPLERAKPDYYLADVIEPPEGVDWTATHAAFLALPESERAGFIFDDEGHRLFAAKGGTVRFEWTLAGGARRQMTYNVALSARGRPRRIYWTDHPYNAPGVDLSGKFVRFFGSEELLAVRYGTVTNVVAGVPQVVTNKVVSGLYIDQSTKLLYAYGQLQGQVVMAYYDTGLFDRLLHVQVVEICRPVVNRLKGEIGRALRPDGRGYDVSGLRARPTYVQASDNRGDWYYQHQGRYSYSPKQGNVYPLRPTVDCPWNMEVYWMETDEMEVDWPFELDHYACDWPEDATVFVRGDGDDSGRPVYVPSDYSATLMSYQDPEGHARAVTSDGTFNTLGEGWSLLRLTADDDIWFVPVHSILRTNADYFTLRPEEIRVGLELTLRTGAAAGLAPGFSPNCDPESPGYIYRAASDPVWNAAIYSDPQPDSSGSGSATNVASGASSGDTNTYASVIYAVSALCEERPPQVEVWWNTTIEEEGMPKPLTIPTLPQVYSVRWPVTGETPQIVIASQLGSASESLYSHNAALVLPDASASATVPSRKFFDDIDGGTVMFWVKPAAGFSGDGEASVLTMSNSSGTSFCVDLRVADSETNVVFSLGGTRRYSCPVAKNALDCGGWYHVAATFSNNMDGNGTARFYVNGRLPGTQAQYKALLPLTWLVGIPHGGAIGACGDTPARAGVCVGELMMWNRVLTASEIREEMSRTHEGRENHLTGCFSFADGMKIDASGTDSQRFTERVLGTRCVASGCRIDGNGPPALGTGLLDPDANTAPKVYVQNDPGETGYNPNEEHAVVMPGSGGYVVWALRSDLNSATSSEPGVLVEYVKGGRKAMQWLDVVVTNSVYAELAGDCVAGKAFPGPHPIDLFDDPWCPEDKWDEPSATAPAFRDRKGQLWARAAGRATMRMYYRMQEGFAFPSLDRDRWPSIGTSVPWLSLLGDSPSATTVLSQKPHPWVWRVSWPDAVPEMEIGRTLTVAASGLPEVWNGKSVGIVWPATDAERDATAVLFDPTVEQSSGFPKSTYDTVAAAIADLGIKQGAGGNASLKKGRWRFDGLPPSISTRFSIDTTADVGSCIKLAGEMEDNKAGVSLLHVNVLNDGEREALKTLLDGTASAAGKTAWRTAIDALATKCVKPSPHVWVSDTEDRIDYSPRDHYALFSMGATNYVTLIENDSTNALMNVATGDPISMHIVRIVPKYWTGRVVTREDQYNLLSQQLSVIYSESFAGDPKQYVFEWRKCRPHADGSVPNDFDGEYVAKFDPTAGLTRFVIGGQGDTLANMVNTYYAMRYRAASESSPAYATMGYGWSEWTDPPALAEGWVQRVLNNVTPFAQRMRDLASNEAETPVSMIVQAGAPYEGDVALNQDNLASVGLIQLYETLLSKAESMSLAVGINDPDANKQLQLAVARLADLYNTLGDEAWTDALNPTIGFGANFDNTQMTGFELDYGALSSTLFAFDNQVPTLLDEELALLRGRTGDNAPSTRISPYYNRLVWNFTKGITAGEVAYAVNYDISGNNKGIIDANDAAEMFPQGHGDAYGHYLSALSGYYRLLRNPYFDWGEPAMGEMVVADSVVNVDYYDEAQFAKAAYNVAKVAAETVDRTARKAYRDNGGATGAGYLDRDATRNFGYGEWASRGGYGALCNWAVGNALLVAEPKSGNYWRHRFTGGESAIGVAFDANDQYALSAGGPWTVEFQIVPSESAVPQNSAEGPDTLVALASQTRALAFSRDPETGMAYASLHALAPVTNTVRLAYYFYTNSVATAESDLGTYTDVTLRVGDMLFACVFVGPGAPSAFPQSYVPPLTVEDFRDRPPEFSGWGCQKSFGYFDEDAGETVVQSGLVTYEDTEIEFIVDSEPSAVVEIGVAPSGRNTLVALRRTVPGTAEAVLIDRSGAVEASAVLDADFSLDLGDGFVQLAGDGYGGEIGELRVWTDAARSNAQLHEKRECVSPTSAGLALYLRTIADDPAVIMAASNVELQDETSASVVWSVEGGEWIVEHESGMSIDFEDEGLKRIDRSTVTELASLADLIPTIQKKIDQMDAGLNPLGLASGALQFDLTPIAPGEDGMSHFEQIRERAGTALSNARKSLEKAQFYGSRTRMLLESQVSREDQLETMELEAKNRLIEYFGYPYEGDIGPGGTYPQGYDGPDIYNYAWMEPALYGLKDDEDVKSVTTNLVVRDSSAFRNGLAVLLPNLGKTKDFATLTYEKSATGIILKPSSVTGRRRACGQIQEKMGEMLVAYRDYKRALDDWAAANNTFEYEIGTIRLQAGFHTAKQFLSSARVAFETFQSAQDAVVKASINTLEFASKQGKLIQESIIGSTPKIVGAGLTVNTDPQSLVAAAVVPSKLTHQISTDMAILAMKNELIVFDKIGAGFDVADRVLDATADYVETYDGYYQRAKDAARSVLDAARDCQSAYAELLNAEAAVETVVAEAERAIEERTLARQQATDALTKARYNEMFFRIVRNNALSRYSAQFDLAQKYVWLAAQAYDYETGLLSTDRDSGERFLARIVGTRTIGEFDDDGDPIVASDAAKGDGGLAAVLAEMDGNWSVLKPRLGINNPQPYATWFSLRHDLFRIYDGEDGDKAWKTALRKYKVDDLNEVAEFRHCCQPLAGSSSEREPGLVIPFPSVIAHGYNFFGEPLAGGDAALDSTYYATHISSAGIHFEGFDDSVLAKTPTAYLVPVGEDRIRAVGDPGTVISWRVVDQTIPAPYAIGSTQLDDPDWTPLYDGGTGGNDLGARIRRHPSFRAYYGKAGDEPSDDSLDCTRLVGRSAWNTKWLLIIPAGSLGADRDAALSAFVNGVDADRDGVIDYNGVSDIRLGLKTYSSSGN